MSTDEQIPTTEAIMQGSVRNIAHDLGNSLHNLCGMVQILEMDLKHHQGHCNELNRELLRGLKNECRRMKSRLEELRRSHDHQEGAMSPATCFC
jgi:nitrogen-specific signal transduction histidine kinase